MYIFNNKILRLMIFFTQSGKNTNPYLVYVAKVIGMFDGVVNEDAEPQCYR